MSNPRSWKLGTILCIATLAGVWAAAQVSTAPPSLSQWLPGRALFYLESSDFAAQLREWNRSEVKMKWLSSQNHEQFLTTRLALKLKDVYEEFSAAAGFAPNLDALETFAGTDSALAVYDIGRLDLVYISRLPTAKLGQNALTRARANYQTRAVAGQSYFVRQSGERTAAFAISGDYVIVSTREDLLAETLELIQGNAAAPSSISQEPWYVDALGAIAGDARRSIALRLVMDLPTVIKTPYFRANWIQRNTSDFRNHSAFLSELTRSADVLEENRVLVRAQSAPVASHDAANTELQRFIPDGVGLVRLWDTTSVDFAMDMIREKFFATGPKGPAARQDAPEFSVDGSVGEESDLQTRIDEAPKPPLAGSLTLEPLRTLVQSAGIEAMMQLESTVPPDDTTFIRSDVAIALRASSPWNGVEVRSALTSAVASYQSVGAIGLQWRDVTSNGHTLSQWNGLIPLTTYVDGQTLWIARTPGLLSTALNRSTAAAPQPAAYVARFIHRTELSPYLRMMRMLDLSDQPNYSSFFSENIGSLASTLNVIQSVSVRINDNGVVQRQVIRYALGN